MDKIKERILEKMKYMFYIFDDHPGNELAEEVVPEIRGVLDTLVDFGKLTENQANAVKAAVAEVNRCFWNDYLQGRKTRQWRKKYAVAVQMVMAL